VQPRFPLPDDLIQVFDNPHRFNGLDNIIAVWRTEFGDKGDITFVLLDIARMAQFINDTVNSAPLWQDIWFLTRRFSPILYELISLPREDLDQLSSRPGNLIREAVRLACIVFLGIMNRRFRVSPDGIVTSWYQLVRILKNTTADWSLFLNLRLWVVVVAGLVAEGSEREWLIGETSNTMKQLELKSWAEALSIVKGIIWVDELLNEEANTLGSEIRKFDSILS
jgi:hypothetical protein